MENCKPIKNWPETMEKKPGTMKNHKTHLEPWKTNLELWKTMKNDEKSTWNHENQTWDHGNPPGTMKNQPGTSKTHKNRPGAIKPTWNLKNPTWHHVKLTQSRMVRGGYCGYKRLQGRSDDFSWQTHKHTHTSILCLHFYIRISQCVWSQYPHKVFEDIGTRSPNIAHISSFLWLWLWPAPN